jgi:enoyl-[acyl-carrier protein] reductase II
MQRHYLNNTLCNLLAITYPILQGGMAWASDSKLACAVSNAGGLGIIGCGGRSSEWIMSEIKRAREATSKPIGLNFPLDTFSDDFVAYVIDEALKSDINIFTISGARRYSNILSQFSDRCIIIPIIGNVMEAKLCQRAGAKALVCEGQESGGTIGRLSTFSILPQVVDAVTLPVIAAGGIADSRGVKAAFALGAVGVQSGTRFLASLECNINQEYKQRIVKAKDTDTVVIYNSIDRRTRVIRNRFALEYLDSERRGENKEFLMLKSRDRLRIAAQESADYGALMAGESSGLIREIMPVSKIIQDLMSV